MVAGPRCCIRRSSLAISEPTICSELVAPVPGEVLGLVHQPAGAGDARDGCPDLVEPLAVVPMVELRLVDAVVQVLDLQPASSRGAPQEGHRGADQQRGAGQIGRDRDAGAPALAQEGEGDGVVGAEQEDGAARRTRTQPASGRSSSTAAATRTYRRNRNRWRKVMRDRPGVEDARLAHGEEPQCAEQQSDRDADPRRVEGDVASWPQREHGQHDQGEQDVDQHPLHRMGHERVGVLDAQGHAGEPVHRGGEQHDGEPGRGDVVGESPVEVDVEGGGEHDRIDEQADDVGLLLQGRRMRCQPERRQGRPGDQQHDEHGCPPAPDVRRQPPRMDPGRQPRSATDRGAPPPVGNGIRCRRRASGAIFAPKGSMRSRFGQYRGRPAPDSKTRPHTKNWGKAQKGRLPAGRSPLLGACPGE